MYIIYLILIISNLDTTTRWNSTYYMIKTAIELKQPLTYVFRNTANKEYKRIFLFPAEWKTLK